MKIIFNDNSTVVHPEVEKRVRSLLKGERFLKPYGQDPISGIAFKKLDEAFGGIKRCLFVPTGTAANSIAIKSFIHSTESIICSDHSHIIHDECGAPVSATGSSLQSVKSLDGIISSESLIQAIKPLHNIGAYHQTKPRLLSISFPNEIGLLYERDKLKDLIATAKDLGLYVHIDGARAFYGFETLYTDLQEFSSLGVDVLSLGLSKLGCSFGDCVVFFTDPRPEDRYHANRIQKQCMSLLDKSWLISSQVVALFEDSLWKNLAHHANSLAKYFKNELETSHLYPEFRVDCNSVFIKVTSELLSVLRKNYDFYLWNEYAKLCRFAFSPLHSIEDVNALSSDISHCVLNVDDFTSLRRLYE